ncbi:glutathione S-transferase family protein [Azospirillum halopraeferens]|uniref:glutathione S-transferase family protein n=1 Tax=Azospirillum halopraeferens TaxID=34010 RepID=UPI0004122434|nr:glutathione S-transferase family protein [Azospirillum halopraeferens]
MTAAYTVHGHFASQPATRVVLFLSMADQPFVYRHVDLAGGQQKTPEHLAVTRFGRVPALEHGDVRLSESGVILGYLARTTGRFGGSDPREDLRIAEWLSWMADALLPIQRARAIRRFNLDPAALPFMDAAAAGGLRQFDAHLAAGTGFVEGGRVTIADIFAFPWIDLLEESGIDVADFPNVRAWHARMLEQPGCRRQYDLMPRPDAG